MKKRNLLRIPCWVICIGVAAVFLLPVTVTTRTVLACTLCRAERTEHTLFGYHQQSDRDTEFTAWYRTHRPVHEHQWGRLTCTRGSSIFGTTTFFACGPRHPICAIPSSTLRDFAERSDTNTLNTFFDGIHSTNRETQLQAVQMALDSLPQTK